MPPLMLAATPSWSISVFETSATFTSSITCCGAATCIMLMMRSPLAPPSDGAGTPIARGAAPTGNGPPPIGAALCKAAVGRATNARASSSTRSALTASETVPVSTSVSAAAFT